MKQATKELHGVRPMFMLMNVFRLLAEKWQCELIGIPHTSQGKYRYLRAVKSYSTTMNSGKKTKGN